MIKAQDLLPGRNKTYLFSSFNPKASFIKLYVLLRKVIGIDMNTTVESKQLFLELLEDYEKVWSKFIPEYFSHQSQTLSFFSDFISGFSDIFERGCVYGHVTGSGFVISKDFTHMLLTYHKKLDKWLQLGGHCDGDHLVHNVALKECREESGLTEFDFFPFEKITMQKTKYPLIFDIDRHIIPKYGNISEHYHFDVRYLLMADSSKELKISSESKDLKWIPIDEVLLLNNETSLVRPVEKIKELSKLWCSLNRDSS